MKQFEITKEKYKSICESCLNDVENWIIDYDKEEVQQIYDYHLKLMRKSTNYLKDDNASDNQKYVAKLQYHISKTMRKYIKDYLNHWNDSTRVFKKGECLTECLKGYYKKDE